VKREQVIEVYKDVLELLYTIIIKYNFLKGAFDSEKRTSH